jgi:hypothetical protein
VDLRARDLRPRLANPLLLLGGAAGWMTAEALRAGGFVFDGGLHVVMLGVTAIAGMYLGAAADWNGDRPLAWVLPRGAALWCCAAAFTGLPVAAAVVLGPATSLEERGGLVKAFVPHALACGRDALFAGAVTLPAAVAVLASHWRIGGARPGSLVDGAQRRGPWLWTFAAIAAGALAALPNWIGLRVTEVPRWLDASLAIAGAALLAACVLLALDVCASLRARRLRGVVARARARDAAEITEPEVDLGIGEREWALAVPAADPYRRVDRVVTTGRGDPTAAAMLLSRLVAVRAVAVLAATACLVAATQLPRAQLVALRVADLVPTLEAPRALEPERGLQRCR